MDSRVEITFHSRIDEIGQTDWDACAAPETVDGGRPFDPFSTYRFLSALEGSHSVGGSSGWMPHHAVARHDGQIVAVAPLYAKSHSRGEYIFDFAWAEAWERAGGRYYPKLQIAVPFTPATGRRFLCRPGFEEIGRAALIEGAVRLAEANRLSSVHVTFCTAEEATAGAELGLLHRVTQQFHWENRNYADFDAFLESLASRKRKTIRKERTAAQAFGGRIVALTGEAIEPGHWDAFWRFYQDTGARKWGSPYLTRSFFEQIHATMRDDILLVMAERKGRWIAGALNFIGRETLYGRYWGAIEEHPFLHFEACYYQAIDWAITQGMARVEAGAQGEHKLARGYLPSETHSLHWIADSGFRRAVAQFLAAERDAVEEEIEVLTGYGPFRRGAVTEQD